MSTVKPELFIFLVRLAGLIYIYIHIIYIYRKKTFFLMHQVSFSRALRPTRRREYSERGRGTFGLRGLVSHRAGETREGSLKGRAAEVFLFDPGLLCL